MDEEGLDKPKYEEEQMEVENPKDGEKLQEDGEQHVESVVEENVAEVQNEEEKCSSIA